MERSTELKPISAHVRDGWQNGTTHVRALAPGETLGALIDDSIEPALIPFLVAQINGEPLADWAQYVPKPDDHILIYILPQGDSGKKVLGLVAAVAIAVFAPYATQAGGFLAGIAGGQAGALAVYTVASTVVMSAIMKNAIKPPQQPEFSSQAVNPFFSFGGYSNEPTPWGTVLRTYGRLRVAPKSVVFPEPDYANGVVYLLMLLDFGYGIQNISGIKVGETDLDKLDAQYKVYKGFTRDTRLSFFSNTSKPQDAGNALITTAGVVKTTALATESLTVEFSMPQGLYALNKTTGAYETTYLKYSIEAKLHGQPDSAYRSIKQYANYIEKNNVNYGSETNAENGYISSVIWDNGKTGDNLITYAGIRAGVSDYEASYAIQTIHGNDAVKTGWLYDPAKNLADTSYTVVGGDGFWSPFIVRLNNVSNTVILQQWSGTPPPYIQYQKPNYPVFFSKLPRVQSDSLFSVGSSWNYYNQDGYSYTDTRQPFSYAIDFTFLTPGQYDIRIKRITPVAADPTYLKNELRWARYISRVGATNTTFNPETTHTVLELRVKATDQLNGSVGLVTAIAEPYIYYWDFTTSTWKFGPTRNPAWIYLDILRGGSNKHPVEDHLIDFDTFKAWAQECNAPPPNDTGVSYTCDLLINSETTVKDALQTVASTGRAAPARRDMMHSVIRRKKESDLPVQLFTQKNSRDFSATINYLNPPHAIKVSFQDETLNYAISEVIVYDDPYDVTKLGQQALTATIFEELTLPGVTRRNQAWRLGRYFLASTMLERERITFSADIENLLAQRGDKIHCVSDFMKIGGLPRRIVKQVGTHIFFDEPAQGVNVIRFRGTNGLVPVGTVSDQEFILPDARTVTIGDVVEYGVNAQIRAPYIIEAIQPGEDFSASIRAVEFRPEVDQAVAGLVPVRKIRPGAVAGFAVGPVQNLKVVSRQVYVDGVARIESVLSWLPPATGRVDYYNVYQLIDGALVWIANPKINNLPLPHIDLSTVSQPYTRTFFVEPVVELIGKGPLSNVSDTVAPDTTPPPTVEYLDLNVVSDQVLLSWAANSSPDVHHYEIRFSADVAAGWAIASKLFENVPLTSTDATAPMRAGRYYIKAVDSSGNYSELAASAVSQVSDTSNLQLLNVYQFNPFNNGTLTNLKLVSNQLVLLDGQTQGMFDADYNEGLHFSTLSRVRLTASMLLGNVLIDNSLDSTWFIPLSKAKPLNGKNQAAIDSANAQVYFRYTDGTTPIDVAPWTRLTVADVTAIDIEFQIKLSSDNELVSPVVSQASVQADWVERTESTAMININQAFTAVSFRNRFATVPTVTITMIEAKAGDYYALNSVNTTGFTITMYNANGTVKAGKISWIAVGFGKLF